jgi:hypothetical protein
MRMIVIEHPGSVKVGPRIDVNARCARRLLGVWTASMAPDLGIDQIVSTDGSAVILKLRGDLDIVGAVVLRSYLVGIETGTLAFVEN